MLYASTESKASKGDETLPFKRVLLWLLESCISCKMMWRPFMNTLFTFIPALREESKICQSRRYLSNSSNGKDYFCMAFNNLQSLKQEGEYFLGMFVSRLDFLWQYIRPIKDLLFTKWSFSPLRSLSMKGAMRKTWDAQWSKVACSSAWLQKYSSWNLKKSL